MKKSKKKKSITKENALKVLKKYLKATDKDRMQHSLRVAQTGKQLAKKWGCCQEDDVIIASLLHDIGKSMSKKEMLNLCVRNEISLYDFEIFETAKALHGKVGSLIFEEEFLDDDRERFQSISHAISCHTSRDSEPLSPLDKIVFIADNIEPNRKNDFLTQILSDKIKTPDECIRLIIDRKRKKAKAKNLELNPMLDATLETLEEER